MMSGPHLHPLVSPVTSPADQPRHDLRLRLKPKASPTGYVDGGWWPRSRDLTVELPALVRVLGVRLGRATHVAFGLPAWQPTPGKITVDGHLIRLEGFHSKDQYVVRVSGPDRRSVSVLVVPPEATIVAAHHAMTAASRRGNADQPVEILVAGGVLPSSVIRRLRLVRDDDAHWANDGGRVGERA